MARAQQPTLAKKATGGTAVQPLATRAVPGPAKIAANAVPGPAEIAARAYELWLQSGRAHGKDQEHWFQAERELRGGKTTH